MRSQVFWQTADKVITTSSALWIKTEMENQKFRISAGNQFRDFGIVYKDQYV